jgi:hypothetical protein
MEVETMAATDLERLKDDLATIRQAAGLELPFGREEVIIGFAVGGGGLIATGWALVPHGLPRHWGFVPLLIVVVVWVIQMRAKYR